MKNTNKLLRINDVLDIVGVSQSHWYRLISNGKAPQAIKISHKWACWDSEDIDRWVKETKSRYSSDNSE